MKVVINRCYGGFGLSPLALQKIAKRKGKECHFYSWAYEDKEFKRQYYLPETVESLAKNHNLAMVFDEAMPEKWLKHHKELTSGNKTLNAWFNKHHLQLDQDRADPDLVAVVEKLGKKAWGEHAELSVVEIPDGIEWGIDEYDGIEHVEERHRSWS